MAEITREVMYDMQWLGAAVRFIVSALVLMFVAFVVPGVEALSFTTALLAALVIAAIGWGIEKTLGRNGSPFSRGIVGFLVSAAVIWASQFIVPGLSVSILGALVAAFIIGIVDLFVPTALR